MNFTLYIIIYNSTYDNSCVIKNCIIFSSVKIGKNCHIENAVIDKYSIVTDGKTFSGDPMKYLFLKQGTVI